ncbi:MULTISPECIES: sulfite exporter TauE/SafE family protein [unclassified Streptomyces]|uniref:urease accessory protein UreH domain-containing protein n=1 Tax=unclassified Streptomyces TaxID=2593676 RepID=UPI000DC7B58B|nr:MULTISPECIES: sulfite exporter TauE/SafE family protein [unclassified Streptomyces]AWZ08586.1 sulfite exporter TauE/SafE family protein [Streptomyces sp. ICC4]AWZ13274.1 sulfite exporter TauE/SafE family protein [Streptomyces sp. ICC1]
MPSSVALLITGASTGLLAGGASCAAIQGGLLAGAVTRRRAPAPTSVRKTPRNSLPASETATPLAPVGAFLVGKLLSHTLLGVLLGIFGSALQPSPRVQAVLMLAAGLLMVLFALDLFGVKGVGRLVPRPPASFGRLMRRSTKTDSAVTPALIGFATVLVPCGVTLSMELLAITSGSAVAGAAVMAGFVLGTSPLFAVLGYLFRRSSQALSGRLAALTGVVVLVVAVWTMASALQAGGWVSFRTPGKTTAASGPFIVEGVEENDPLYDPGAGQTGVDLAPVSIDASGKQIVTLTVTDFYVPTQFTARAGVPTTLVLHGKDSGGCARAFTIPELGVQEIVKRDGDTEIDLGTRKPGTLRFSCAMGMQTGAIDFKKDLQ